MTVLRRPSRSLAVQLLFLALTPALAAGQYGIEAPTAIGPYLNGVFPDATPGAADQYDLVPAFPALTFSEPLVITPHPSAPTMFVATRDGQVFSFDDDPQVSSKTTFLDLRDRCAVVWDGGMLGFTPHPNFGLAGLPSSRHVFAYYCYTPTSSYPPGFTNGFFGCYLRLSRFSVPTGSNVADPSSEEVMMQVRLYNGSHRGGDISFGPDGFLYVPIGDQFRYEPAQDIQTNLEGGVHRVDVDMDPARSHAPLRTLPTLNGDEVSGVGYWIPNDNPFVDPTGARFEEYWSLGHRNPHRMSFDSVSGELWIGEVGENDREELNVVEGGGNYGWPFREGFLPGPRPEPQVIVGTLTDPVLDFMRSEAQAIIGGYVYRGAEHPSLYGRFICADYGQDRLYAVDFDGATGLYSKVQVGALIPGEPITFGQSLDGELYLGRQSSSTTLFKLEGRDPAPEPPPTLSSVGAFVDLAALQPAPGLVPFALNAPFWSDGAEKSRWVAVPNDGTHDTPAEQVEFEPSGTDWAFPPGSVAIKHFEIGIDDTNPSVKRRLETRFTVFTDDGFYGVSYHWLPDGSDALLASGPTQTTLEVATAEGPPRLQTWSFPGRQDCNVCHAPETGGALGLRTHQLNRDLQYPTSGVVDNQLRTWNHLGVFDVPIPEPAIPGLPRGAGLDDPLASRELKARSYLDSNCSHCHRPDSGTRAVFDARFSTPLYSTDLLFGEVSSDLGIAGAEVVSPRRVHRSIALLRTNALGGIAMPPLGKAVVDEPGVALLTDWVRNLADSPHTNIGNPPEGLPALDAWDSNLVINKTDTVTNVGSAPMTLRIESFRFWAADDRAPITPFVVTVTGPDAFVVEAIGATRGVDTNGLGHNAFPFVDGRAPIVTLLPGETLAVGFLDAASNGSGGGGAVVPFCICNGADDVWITGGPGGGDSGSVVVGSAPTPGAQTLTGLARDYAFSIDVVEETPNAPPVFGSLPDQTFQEGADVEFSVMATDAPGDILVYTAAGLPFGVSLDPETGAATGTLSVLGEGTYPVTVTASDGRAEGTGTFDLIVTPQPYAELFAVVEGASGLPGVGGMSTGDVLRLDLVAGVWALHFVGADVGVTAPISGLHVEPSGDLLMSFERPLDLVGLTGGPSGARVDPLDIVRFRPTTTGSPTSGTFEFVLDGSDLSFLHDVGASIDALTRLGDGRLAFSTRGRATLAGTPVRDQDLVAFSGTAGAATSGTVAVVFRGSDVGLGARDEDLDAASVDAAAGGLLVSVRAEARANGASSFVEFGPADIAAFAGALQAPTTGVFSSLFRGERLGITRGSAQVRAISLR